VIIPVFNEGENILLLHKALSSVLKGIDQEAEVIFIDDGSSDNTLIHLRAISEKDPSVKVLALSRNFGQTAALSAGSIFPRERLSFQWTVTFKTTPRISFPFFRRLRRGMT